MSASNDALVALQTALGTITGLRVYRAEQAAAVVPPCAVVGPPILVWETFCTSEPPVATFNVYIVVDDRDRSVEKLLDLVETSKATIETAMGGAAAVTGAIWFNFPGPTQDLPSYHLTVVVDCPSG